ncbi:MAG TPA: hypothetical protein VMM17_06040 [Gemmatimonadaceae bacterium]|nr:hypothetical protein [Gemmatimonadaceae bacterium]
MELLLQDPNGPGPVAERVGGDLQEPREGWSLFQRTLCRCSY